MVGNIKNVGDYTILAMVNVKTGELLENKRQLTWLMTDEQCHTKENIFWLEAEKIYRLKVRESLEYVHPFTGKVIEAGARLLVCEVIERDCVEERLGAILVKYQQPVTLHPEGCEELLLDKSLGVFCGEGVWNGHKCLVHLDVDEDAETADDALATWNKLRANAVEWDKKAREYAAQKLVDNANDWLADGVEEDEEVEEITKEIFAQRMNLSEVCISTGGNFEIYYDDDDMFWGHVIIVNGNIDEGYDDATIAG